MVKSYLTKNLLETKVLARNLAKKFLKIKKRKKALILALEGELGSGKTTFLQGFAKGLGIKEKILSPTFVIIRKFNIKHPTSHLKHFYHIDCYRIQKPGEVLALGFKKIISNPKNIVAIEWADKIRSAIPKNPIWIKFKFVDKKIRKIIIKNSYSMLL